MSNDYTHILGVHVWVAGYVNNFSNTVQHPSMSKSSTRYSFGVQFGTINYSAARRGANHFKHMRCKRSGSAHPSAWTSGWVRRRLEQASTVSRPPANYTTHKVRAHCNVCRLSAETKGHLWGDGRSFFFSKKNKIKINKKISSAVQPISPSGSAVTWISSGTGTLLVSFSTSARALQPVFLRLNSPIQA